MNILKPLISLSNCDPKYTVSMCFPVTPHGPVPGSAAASRGTGVADSCGAPGQVLHVCSLTQVEVPPLHGGQRLAQCQTADGGAGVVSLPSRLGRGCPTGGVLRPLTGSDPGWLEGLQEALKLAHVGTPFGLRAPVIWGLLLGRITGIWPVQPGVETPRVRARLPCPSRAFQVLLPPKGHVAGPPWF